jgi:ElaB/YqjD/DUF883 family membrane-anchored ribosome-binding protein
MPKKKSNFVNHTRERIGEGFDYSKDKAIEAKHNIDEFVKKNPTTSILIAAAIGALVSLGVTSLVSHSLRRPKSFIDKLRDRFY